MFIIFSRKPINNLTLLTSRPTFFIQLQEKTKGKFSLTISKSCKLEVQQTYSWSAVVSFRIQIWSLTENVVNYLKKAQNLTRSNNELTWRNNVTDTLPAELVKSTSQWQQVELDQATPVKSTMSALTSGKIYQSLTQNVIITVAAFLKTLLSSSSAESIMRTDPTLTRLSGLTLACSSRM